MFVGKTFTSLQTARPDARFCPYTLVIHKDARGDLQFIVRNYGERSGTILFTLMPHDLQNVVDTADQKRFEFQTGPLTGSATYMIHPGSRPFYEIMIRSYSRQFPSECRYSDQLPPR